MLNAEHVSIRPRLEVRIPISPSPSMFNRALLIGLSIRLLGKQYEDTVVRVSVGAEEDEATQLPIWPDFPHWAHKAQWLKWHQVPRKQYLRWRHTANPNLGAMVEDRFFCDHDFPDVENVLFLDVDVLAITPFDGLMGDWSAPVQATMAHCSPFIDHIGGWKKLLGDHLWDSVNKFEHSGWGIMEGDPHRRFSPPYFNTGVVMMNRSALRPFAVRQHEEALASTAALYNSYFLDQIAFTMMLLRTALPYSCLPLRYNFPNQHEFDVKYAGELEEVKFVHFLRTDIIDRNRDFESVEAMERLVNRTDLTGSNEVLRKRVDALLPFFKEIVSQ